MVRPIEELLPAEVFVGVVDLSSALGGPGYGWFRDDALRVVDEAERAHLVILGGDVWTYGSEHIKPANANWSENVGRIKPRDNDVARAAEHARRYIASYPVADTPAERAVFEIVFGETSLGH